MTASSMARTSRSHVPVKPFSAGEAALLQLAPGEGNLIVFIFLAWLFSGWGLPPILALGVTIMVAEVPLCWWLMVRTVKRETGGRFSFKDAFPWQERIPWWQYLVIGVPAVVLSAAVIFAGSGIGEAIRPILFGWVPDWFVMSADPQMFFDMPRRVLIAMWLISIFVMTGIGGFTQELYSRGFLLPRTAHLGLRAPALNALWFAIFHMISPWSWPGFFILALPWAYLVWWKRSVKIGLFVHIGMLALQSVTLTLIVFGVAPPPAAGN